MLIEQCDYHGHDEIVASIQNINLYLVWYQNYPRGPFSRSERDQGILKNQPNEVCRIIQKIESFSAAMAALKLSLREPLG